MSPLKKIPVSTAVVMSINIMLGVGLYAGVHRMAAVAGNASFLGWVIVALLNLPIVYAISRMAALVPESGGFYRYAYKTFGRIGGFFGLRHRHMVGLPQGNFYNKIRRLNAISRIRERPCRHIMARGKHR